MLCQVAARISRIGKREMYVLSDDPTPPEAVMLIVSKMHLCFPVVCREICLVMGVGMKQTCAGVQLILRFISQHPRDYRSIGGRLATGISLEGRAVLFISTVQTPEQRNIYCD